MQGIFATINDLQKLYNCSYSAAQRNYQVIKDSLAKEKHQKITINELCDYLGITKEDFFSIII